MRLPGDAQSDKIEIWFQDEMRVGQRGTVTRLRTEKGKRPCVVRQQQFISGYIFGAVCPEKDKGCGLIMPAANTEAMQFHISEISRNTESGHHALIIADQAAWHTTSKLKLPENISILPLPPYSPELNPAERIWEKLRQDRLSNRCFKDYEDIADACCEAWNEFISEKGKIKSMCSREWAKW